MRLTRIYSLEQLQTNHTIFLDTYSSNHLLRVLRLKVRDPFILFDGQGHEFHAEIIAITKQLAQVLIKEPIPTLAESPLMIHLGQAICRSEKMDYTLQKAVELGVKTITPLFTDYSNVKLSAERLNNKLDHWRKVVISACEQSGRSYLPDIATPQHLSDFLKQSQADCKLLLHPHHEKRLKDISSTPKQVCLLVGPEGGFSTDEIKCSQQLGFDMISLGPRILRTETAAPAAITALQCLWGDMG